MRLLPIICSLMLLAGNAVASPTESEVAAEPQVASAESTQAGKAEEVRKADRNCLRETGSRIKRKDKGGCLPLAGRTYSKDDLDGTGAVTVADALERLDPAIRRGH